MNDFQAGYNTALVHEIEHWDAIAWDTAIAYVAERERATAEGDLERFERHQGMGFWHRAQYHRAQIVRLSTGLSIVERP